MASPATTTSRIGTSAAGFTLIELALVAVVIAILLSGAVPRLQQVAQRMRAEQAAFELAHLLRVAHEQAVSEGEEIVWVWDRQAVRARLEAAGTDDVEAAPQSVPLSLTSGPLPQELTVEVLRDGEPVECRCVRFFPGGTSEPATLTVGLRQQVFTLNVDAATGYIRLSAGVLAR